MRKIITILSVVLLIASFSCSQPSGKNKKNAVITFNDTVYNFQNIEQDAEASYNFIFKNTGKEPLLIKNVTTTCGCTTPDWTRSPVKKKKSGVVKVNYNTNILGSFHKTISVYSNASNSPVVLTIQGIVVPKSEKSPKK